MKHQISILVTATLLVVSFYFLNETPYFVFIAISIVFLFLGLVVLGSSLIQLNYFVKSINKSSNKGISITFDDGPDNKLTPQLLNLLEQEKISATFFIIGSKIKGNEKLLADIYQKGHTIGNHSFAHHKKITYQPTKNLLADVELCNTSIQQVIGKQPLFFRPPFGVTTPRYNRVLKKLKMQSIGWNIRSFDTTATDKKKLYNKIIQQIKDGSIVLFHDTQEITLAVLPDIIMYCKQNGIKIVPLPQLINQQPYV